MKQHPINIKIGAGTCIANGIRHAASPLANEPAYPIQFDMQNPRALIKPCVPTINPRFCGGAISEI